MFWSPNLWLTWDFALLRAYTVNKIQIFADYWTSDPFLENKGVKAFMTKNSFKSEIYQYLHFSDSSH